MCFCGSALFNFGSSVVYVVVQYGLGPLMLNLEKAFSTTNERIEFRILYWKCFVLCRTKKAAKMLRPFFSVCLVCVCVKNKK